MSAKAKRQPEDSTRWFVMAQLAEAINNCAVAEAEAEVARKVRDDAIRRAKSMGLSLAEIATFSGLSRARVQQLAPTSDVDEADVPVDVEIRTVTSESSG